MGRAWSPCSLPIRSCRHRGRNCSTFIRTSRTWRSSMSRSSSSSKSPICSTSDLLLEEPEQVEPLHGEVSAANVGVTDSDGISSAGSGQFRFSPRCRCGDRRPEQQRQKPRAATVCPARHTDQRAAGHRRNRYQYCSARSFRPSHRLCRSRSPTLFFCECKGQSAARPASPAERSLRDDGSGRERSRGRAIEEARKSGNSEFDIAGRLDRLPAGRGGRRNRAGAAHRRRPSARRSRRGRASFRIARPARPRDASREAARRVLEARRVLAERLAGAVSRHLVERFDPTATTPIRRFPSICCSARRSGQPSKAMGSPATLTCRACSKRSGSLTT